jgi:DDE superfamily endonuclease
VKTWCIPPQADAEFVFHMEDVLATNQLPYDPEIPVIFIDEASKQLIGKVATPLPTRPGQPKCVDYEYERLGVCSEFIFCEPLAGWRHVKVTDRRTKKDWAQCIRELVDVYYPDAQKVRLVLDNLNTHTGASLYEAFAPEEARRILERLEFHYTPKSCKLVEHGGDRDRDHESPVPGPTHRRGRLDAARDPTLGGSAKRQTSQDPLDVHHFRCPGETQEALPVNQG